MALAQSAPKEPAAEIDPLCFADTSDIPPPVPHIMPTREQFERSLHVSLAQASAGMGEDFLAGGRLRDRARALRRLRSFPLSGPQVREFPQLPLRQFFVQPYRFFYRVDQARKLIWIVELWHGAQDIRAPELPAPS